MSADYLKTYATFTSKLNDSPIDMSMALTSVVLMLVSFSLWLLVALMCLPNISCGSHCLNSV